MWFSGSLSGILRLAKRKRLAASTSQHRLLAQHACQPCVCCVKYDLLVRLVLDRLTGMCDSTETVPLQGYSAQWQTHLDVYMTKIYWILCDWIDEGTTLNPAATCSLVNPDPLQPSDQNPEIVSTSYQRSYQSSGQGPENLILTRRGSQRSHRRTR